MVIPIYTNSFYSSACVVPVSSEYLITLPTLANVVFLMLSIMAGVQIFFLFEKYQSKYCIQIVKKKQNNDIQIADQDLQ